MALKLSVMSATRGLTDAQIAQTAIQTQTKATDGEWPLAM
jgi:hypothetical protein